MSQFIVVLDACVLYPAPLRDLLMRLALADLFRAKWTDQIHDEWINALLRNNSFKREKLERIKFLMDEHARDAKVTDYEGLIESIKLPDPNDRHVLAAAIKCNADAIVTFNSRDFPDEIVSGYDIEIIHPDDFVNYQLDLSLLETCNVIKRQRQALRNPPVDRDAFLIALQKQQLPKTVSALRQYIDFI